jgi:hypothetical protein
MASSITVLNFDNRPFTRSLTARANGVNSTDTIRWVYPSNASAQTTAFAAYPSNSTALVSQIGTLIFSFSGTTYDYRTENYTLCTLQLSCLGTSTSATTGIIFDTFPNIDLKLFINYENTESSSYFYRLTSTQPFTGSANLAPYFVNLVSNSYNLLSTLSASYYQTWYSLNRNSTRLTNLTALTGFDRTTTTRVSSIQATLTAIDAPDSLTPFWSPHILERSLSAVFVPYFLSGDFIGYPKGYFSSRTQFDTLNPVTNLQSSPGLRFYGEGHTETIFLSATKIDSRATRYVWRLNNSQTLYPLFSTLSAQPLSSVFVVLTSQVGNYPVIPVSLHLTNSLFLSTDPYYYFDDITGTPTPYPYYISTTDFYGNESTPRNKFKESIHILPYDPIEFQFIPGINSVIYLPVNGSQVNYTSILRNSLLGEGSLSACFGLYGLIWNWLTFTGCSANPGSFTGKPSSWETVACSAIFPKTWQQGPALSASLFSTNPASCSAINMVWTLSTQAVQYQVSAIPGVDNEFNFSLSLENNGGNLTLGTDGRPNITTSFFTNSDVLLKAYQTIRCQISAQLTSNAIAAGYTNDWKPADTAFDEVVEITSVAPPQPSIYTANRFVLTGTNVVFENLSERTNLLSAIVVDLDDEKTLTLQGADLNKPFSTSYEVVGDKTIKLTLYPNYDPTPITVSYPNLIRVFNIYDEVSPSEYRSSLTPLNLPWPNKPQIGSNDWAVEDNINNWFRKFYENLEYLESRGRTYPATVSDYFGYLGPAPTVVGDLTACETWTWEDLDCFNTSLPYSVTWRDVLSAEDPTDPNGRFVDQGCAAWQTYECTNRQINPICYGKYDVEWSWRARKKGNTLTPITWKQTQCEVSEGVFPKLWKFEPAENQLFVVCDEGQWHVNIPQLDTFYEPIANPAVQLRCIYNGIVSRDNILYLAQKTQLRLHNASRDAVFFDYQDTIDGVLSFSNIKNVSLDSVGKIYILDNILSQVAVYSYERNTPGENFKLFTIWGGFGTAASTTKFSNPNDLHIDQLDNVWVTDTGNGCVKHYSNTGTWIKTIIDDNLKSETPLSTCVDSQQNVHILTNESIRVYTYTGEFLFSYDYKNDSSAEPRKINTSYNREVIYLVLDTQVLKYFRNGIFFAYIVKDKENVYNITGVYQDEFRNVLITTNDKVLKYPDIMTIQRLKGILPDNYWKLEDILIHKEEYIQNWVYTKAFQRMWDNIEIFRNTIFFENSFCKGYRPPVHSKDKIIIGQNEIVTATVVNRVLGYLWENFTTMLDYFDPSCEEPL